MSDQTNLSAAPWPRSKIIAAWALVQTVIVGILIFWPFANGDPLYYFRNSVKEPTRPQSGAIPCPSTRMQDCGQCGRSSNCVGIIRAFS